MTECTGFSRNGVLIDYGEARGLVGDHEAKLAIGVCHGKSGTTMRGQGESPFYSACFSVVMATGIVSTALLRKASLIQAGTKSWDDIFAVPSG